MRKLKYACGIIICSSLCLYQCQPVQHSQSTAKFNNQEDKFEKETTVGPKGANNYVVATSQFINPSGKTITFSGRPVDLSLNADESILAVKNMNEIVFINVEKQNVIQTLPLPKTGHTFTGIAWSSGNKVWTTDEKGFLRSAQQNESGMFIWKDIIRLPANDKTGPFPGGIAIDEKEGVIYVALNRNNSLCMVNMQTGKVMEEIPVGIAPYSVIISQGKAYVTDWGGRRPLAGDKTAASSGTMVVIDKHGVASSGTVSVIDLATRKLVNEIDVQLHPSGMVLSPDRFFLYVANANSDIVSVIDTRTDKVTASISSKPIEELPYGSAPNDVAVSPDGKTLYIADGVDNLVAVVDLTSKKLKGLIPAGWYPSAVRLSADGSKIFVCNMKGVGSRQPVRERGYNTQDLMGSVTMIETPSQDSLESYSIQAAVNMRLPKINEVLHLSRVKEKHVPVPVRPGEKSLIKHVLYVIKENRTYDQVFGDMAQGNGDSSLTMFGRYVTPNHHKLAEEFVLLDNTYCNGVKSAEGHQWTSQGYVTDYLEKAFPGFVRGYPWNGNDPLVYSASGFIWDYVLAAGLSFRDYGEYVNDEIIPANASWTDIYNDYINGTHKIKIRAVPAVYTIANNICPTYTGSPREINDQYKADEFIKELHDFEKADTFPNLMMMSLPNNHTSGTQEGFPIPSAMVADNDLALGRIVEAISKSKFWKETAIFVVEDDPQNGLDHVDGHRTVAFCISPYTKRKAVVNTHYNQNSILRTIELILGLPPMTQLDLVASPMSDCFTDKPDFTPYNAVKNNIPLNLMNPKIATLSGKQLYWAKKSMQLHLEENDAMEEEEELLLNQVLWHAVKGYDRRYPKSR
jgi:YVTN family beta-propeller protein